MSCILLVMLTSIVPFAYLNFLSPIFSQYVFSVLCLFPSSSLKQFYIFPLPICFFLAFFMALIHFLQTLSFPGYLEAFIQFLFKDLFHLHEDGFKVIFWCFSWVGGSGYRVVGELGSVGEISP